MSEGLLGTSLTIFLLFYYNQVLGLSGTLTGTALSLGLVADAISDPLMGAISDRTRSRIGRRHPFIFAAALPLGVCAVLLFTPPAGLEESGLFLWLATFAVLSRLALTLFYVPHMALGAEFTTDYGDRNNFVALRRGFAAAGSVFAMVVGFGIYFVDTEAYPKGQYNPDGYLPFSLVIAATMVVTLLLCGITTLSRVPYLPPAGEMPKLSIRQFVRENLEVLSNRNFRALFVGVLGFEVIVGAYYSMMLHMNIHFWKLESRQIFIFMISMTVVNVASLAAWAYITQFFEKRSAFLVGVVLWAAFIMLPPSLALLGLMPPNESPYFFPTLLGMTIISLFSGAATSVLGGSMVADCVDEQELAIGRRQEGGFFGVYGFAAKAMMGLGLAFAGVVLDLIGFPANAAPGSLDETVLTRLALANGPLLAFMGAMSFVFLLGYRISRERHAETLAKLSERRQAGVSSSIVAES